PEIMSAGRTRSWTGPIQRRASGSRAPRADRLRPFVARRYSLRSQPARSLALTRRYSLRSQPARSLALTRRPLLPVRAQYRGRPLMAATKVRKRDTGEAGNKGEFGSLHRGESQVEVQVDEKPVEYSFLEKFEAMADQYEHDFEGFPISFANADLRGKYLPAPGGDPAREARFMRSNHTGAIPQRMALAVSSTSDLKMTDEE